MSEEKSTEQQPPAALNLDSLEREGGPKQPYVVIVNGKRYMFADPEEVDWQDVLAGMRDPVLFIRMVLPPDDHAEFFRTKIASWKMEALIKGYREHYGLPDPLAAPALPR